MVQLHKLAALSVAGLGAATMAGTASATSGTGPLSCTRTGATSFTCSVGGRYECDVTLTPFRLACIDAVTGAKVPMGMDSQHNETFVRDQL